MNKGEFQPSQGQQTTFYEIGGRVRAVQYRTVDGWAIAEGCMILGTVQEAEETARKVRQNPGLLRDRAAAQGIGIKGTQYRWPNKTLPYVINGALPNPNRVTDAITHWTANTAIKFITRTNEPDYVEFIDGSGCASSVGRRGGRQVVMLGSDCTAGNCIHEIGHTLGLFHEQSRGDRDAFIEIRWANILPGYESNFYQQLNDGQDLGAYDFGSIMHYPLDACSANGQPTIQVVGNAGGVHVGQRLGLSQTDKAAIAQMYP